MKIKGSTALITGSAVRLGMHMATHLVARGCDTVIIHYNKSEADARKLKENLEELGARVKVLHGDLSTADGIKSFLSECSKACRTIDILVNSASNFVNAPLLSEDISNYMPSIVVNGLAPHAIIVWAYKNAGLKKSINILDASPWLYARDRYGYYLGKLLLESVTKRLAMELAPSVCVNAIAPGYILQPMANKVNNSRIQNIPLKRKGRISELNMALDFLIHNDYITGQIIYVDGGAHLMSDGIDR